MPTTPANQREEEETNPAQRQQGAVQAAIGIASSLLALGAYVYLLGGFVLWLKLTAARLPTDNAVGALDGNRLLAVGLKALVFELVLVGLLLGLAFLAWEGVRYRDVKAAKRQQGKAVKEQEEIARERPGERGQMETAELRVEDAAKAVASAAELNVAEKWEVWRRLLQALIVGILAGSFASSAWRWALPSQPPAWLGVALGLVAAGLWLLILRDLILAWADRREGRRRAAKTWLTVFAAGLSVFLLAAPAGVGVLVLLLFLHLSHLLKELHKITDPTHLITAVLIVAGCLSAVVAMYLATPPVSLESAAVVVADGGGQRTVRGGYVGRSGDGVYLAVCAPARGDPKRSARTRLRVIGSGDIRGIVLGEESGYVLDDGMDPSLFDMASYAIAREPLGEWVETVSLDVREGDLTCGFPHQLEITKRIRGRKRGMLRLEMTVPDDGVLTLAGDEVLRRRVEVDGAGWHSLKIEPRPKAERLHRCEARFATAVRASFRHGDDPPQIEAATVTLANPKGRRRGGRPKLCRGSWVHPRRMVRPPDPEARSNAR